MVKSICRYALCLYSTDEINMHISGICVLLENFGTVDRDGPIVAPELHFEKEFPSLNC